MAERLRRAAAWLGLVTDDRYGEYDRQDADAELTESVEVTDAVAENPATASAAWDNASVTELDTRRTGTDGREAIRPVSVRSGRVGDAGTKDPTRQPATASSSTTTPSTATRTADLSRIITVHPRTYNEARTIGENFRDGVPVIMNLSDMEDSDAKRLVDFAAGLIFGLHGSIERVTSKVFLLCPPNVNVTAEDKERIVGGFFNQS